MCIVRFLSLSSAWWDDITSHLCPRAGGIFASSLVWFSFEEGVYFFYHLKNVETQPMHRRISHFVRCFVWMFSLLHFDFDFFFFCLWIFSVSFIAIAEWVAHRRRWRSEEMSKCMCVWYVLYEILSMKWKRVRCKWETVSQHSIEVVTVIIVVVELWYAKKKPWLQISYAHKN